MSKENNIPEEDIPNQIPFFANKDKPITTVNLANTSPESSAEISQSPAALPEAKALAAEDIPAIVSLPEPGKPDLSPTKLNSNMETHHAHHVAHDKKWKDYLFEFLMLFLAILAGFFVENQREHYIENKRAAKFSKHLLADLRLDSLLFENRQRDLQVKQQGHDRLQYLLTEKANATNKEILEALLPITFAYDMPVTTTTYNQMKSSGSLRYINNPELTANLQNYYDVLLPRCTKITDASLTYFTQYINPFYLKHIRIQDYDPFNDSLINKQPVILHRSRQTDQELANIMGGYRSILKIQAVTMNEPALKKLKATMAVLKTEYHLK